MFGLKAALCFALMLISFVEAGKRNAQCDAVCQRKMTIECCECIGCHQGMRFGKRSQSFTTPELEEAIIAQQRANEMNGIEEAIVAIEMELANRAPRRLLEKYNH